MPQDPPDEPPVRLPAESNIPIGVAERMLYALSAQSRDIASLRSELVVRDAKVQPVLDAYKAHQERLAAAETDALTEAKANKAERDAEAADVANERKLAEAREAKEKADARTKIIQLVIAMVGSAMLGGGVSEGRNLLVSWLAPPTTSVHVESISIPSPEKDK